MRYLIIADDFTGANDTGVQLKRKGLNTNVVFTNELVKQNTSTSFVIDTESRAMHDEDAYNAVKNTLEGIDFDGFSHIIKKVDSTLRGNIGKELLAVDDIFKSELIIFAPALPDLNRTTLNDIQMLNGKPITKTELVNDPKNPVSCDNLSEILKKVFNEPIGHIDIQQIENGKIDFKGKRIYTCDASKNSHLKAIVANALSLNKKILWVGTAAIAQHLIESHAKIPPVLAVVGSVSSVSKSQILFAEQSGITLVKIPMDLIMSKEVDTTTFELEILDFLQKGQNVLILPYSTYDDFEFEKTEKTWRGLNMTSMDAGIFIQNTLGDIACNVLKQIKVSGMFIAGGDTAIGFLRKSNSAGSTIEKEILIGIPMLTLTGGVFDGLKMVTKAGAFGKEDSIAFSIRKLEEVSL